METPFSDASRPTRVLVADDERPLRDAIRELIDSDLACEVVGTAGDAEEALSLAREHDPDVVMVDVRMPHGGGQRVAEELQLSSPRTRVLVLSAYADRTTVVTMMRAGAIGYLVKGASSSEILEAVHRAARGQASLSAELAAGVIDTMSGDIAEQRASEQLLRHSEEQTRGLLEHAPDAVVIVDEDGQIVLVNHQTEEMFGYARTELAGQRVEILLPDRFVDRHHVHRSGYIRDPRTREMGIGRELAGRRKDGSEFPVDISLSATETEGGRLVTAFVRDATDRKVLEEMRRREAERRVLLGHLVAVAEDERKRIAADIHDDSIQAMAAASIRLQILRRRLHGEEELSMLDELARTTDLAIERLRHLLFELRPPALDREGIVPALQLYLREAGGGVRYRLEEDLHHEPPPDTRVILYRLAQEALTNVRKHAAASAATVILDEHDAGYRLRVADDGVGFDTGAAGPVPGHLGLAAMRERAELAGGHLHIDSELGAGTTVEVWIPPVTVQVAHP
ncbi:MAG: PAS domain S-box protein [Solirubrobacteraceae bacterium]|nr:PAS domain S-box protein [Solirubrobacteraceae bacterium]